MCSRLQQTGLLQLLSPSSQGIQQLWRAGLCLSATSTSYSPSPFLIRQFAGSASVQHVVPRELLRELRSLDLQAHKASQLDGRQRQSLSLAKLTTSIPKHDIEAGLPAINVHVRPDTGKNFCKWLRKSGRTPARVMSLPGTMNVHMKAQDGEKLIRQFGVHGCQSRIVQLNVVHPDDDNKVLAKLRVKPHSVYIRSNTAMLEAVTFLYCPQDRIVEVDVPIKLMNDDAAPGIKKGGWMFINKRLVQYKCLGLSVPPCIEVDVRHLELNQVIRLRDLPIPPGTKLMAKVGTAVEDLHVLYLPISPGTELMAKNYNQIVVTCTNDVTETTNLSPHAR